LTEEGGDVLRWLEKITNYKGLCRIGGEASVKKREVQPKARWRLWRNKASVNLRKNCRTQPQRRGKRVQK